MLSKGDSCFPIVLGNMFECLGFPIVLGQYV